MIRQITTYLMMFVMLTSWGLASHGFIVSEIYFSECFSECDASTIISNISEKSNDTYITEARKANSTFERGISPRVVGANLLSMERGGFGVGKLSQQNTSAHLIENQHTSNLLTVSKQKRFPLFATVRSVDYYIYSLRQIII